MKRVVVLTTGGTISTRDVDGSGAKPALRGQDLLKEIPGLSAAAEWEVGELAFARGLGTLVVLHEEIHSARWVTKTNGQKEDTYESPATGPLGIVYGDGPHVFARSLPRTVLPPRLEPQVDLIRLCVDCDDKFVRCAADAGTRGLVLEVFGGGRVNPPLLPALDRALAGGMMVVATTRCITGNMWDMYGYEGAFRDLQRRGIVFAHDLPGHKARLKLMLALGNGLSRAQATEYFAEP